jgi:hypothetical protein
MALFTENINRINMQNPVFFIFTSFLLHEMRITLHVTRLYPSVDEAGAVAEMKDSGKERIERVVRERRSYPLMTNPAVED